MKIHEILAPMPQRGSIASIKSSCRTQTPSETPSPNESLMISNARAGREEASVSRPLPLHVVMRKGSTDYSQDEHGRGFNESNGDVEIINGAWGGRGNKEEIQNYRIELQPRDREILRVCYEQGFLIPEHIEKFFFTGKSNQSARERVLELEKAGFISRPDSPIFGRRRIIRLTEIGECIAIEGHSLEVNYLRRLVPSNLMHDATVTALSLRLKQLFNGDWIPEKAIKAIDTPRIPDGLFVLASGDSVALELENSAKGKARFLRMLKTWMQNPGADFLLFVATTDALKQMIKRYLELLPGTQKIGVILWSELRISTPAISTVSREIPITEVFCAKREAA